MRQSIGRLAIRCMALALLLEVTMLTINNDPRQKPVSREHFSRSHRGS